METGPQKQISGSEVLEAFSEVRGSNFIYQVSKQKEQLKPYLRIESINEHCAELSEEQRQKLIAFCEITGGRLPVHMYRMLGDGRSQAEKNFAFKFIENYSDIKKEILDFDRDLIDNASDDDLLDLHKTRLDKILGGESIDSGMFWTFAPYIFKNLSNKDAQDRIRKICNWGLMLDRSSDVLEDENFRQLHLKGLDEVWSSLNGHVYYLAIKPDDLTHKYTDQESRKLVEAGVFK